MVWMGIDPGKKGGICTIDKHHNIDVIPMPDAADLAPHLKKAKAKHVYLEKSQAMPGQGVSSMFTYGVGYGIIQGILIAYKIPFTLISPKTWQKLMFTGTDATETPKKRALQAATRIFAKPASFWLPTSRSKKPHDGMIDSALLAEACRRQTK